MAITALTARNIGETTVGFEITFDSDPQESVVAIIPQSDTYSDEDLYNFDVDPAFGLWYGSSFGSAGTYNETDYGVEFPINLQPGTQYRLIAMDLADGSVETYDFETAGETDTTAPTLSNPTYTDLTHNSFRGRVTTDEGNGQIQARLYAGTDHDLETLIDEGTPLQTLNQPVSSAGVVTIATAFAGLTPETGYTVVYVHTDAASNVSDPVAAEVTTAEEPQAPQEAPEISTPVSVTRYSATIEYSSVDDATGYRLSLDGGAYNTIESSPYNLTGLIPGRQYTVRVRASNATGDGPESDPVQFTTDAPIRPLSGVIPRHGAASAVGQDQVQTTIQVEGPDAGIEIGVATSYTQGNAASPVVTVNDVVVSEHAHIDEESNLYRLSVYHVPGAPTGEVTVKATLSGRTMAIVAASNSNTGSAKTASSQTGNNNSFLDDIPAAVGDRIYSFVLTGNLATIPIEQRQRARASDESTFSMEIADVGADDTNETSVWYEIINSGVHLAFAVSPEEDLDLPEARAEVDDLVPFPGSASFVIGYTGEDEVTFEYRIDGGEPVACDQEDTVTGLDGLTTYEIEVRALTEDGPGEWSDPYEFTTLEPIPVKVEIADFDADSGTTSLSVTVTIPEEDNALEVCVHTHNASSVTAAIGETDLTVTESSTRGGGALTLFRLLDAPSGEQTIDITATGSVSSIAIAVAYANVDSAGDTAANDGEGFPLTISGASASSGNFISTFAAGIEALELEGADSAEGGIDLSVTTRAEGPEDAIDVGGLPATAGMAHGSNDSSDSASVAWGRVEGSSALGIVSVLVPVQEIVVIPAPEESPSVTRVLRGVTDAAVALDYPGDDLDTVGFQYRLNGGEAQPVARFPWMLDQDVVYVGITGLIADTEYVDVQFRATTEGGVSAWSDPVTFRTFAELPESPIRHEASWAFGDDGSVAQTHNNVDLGGGEKRVLIVGGNAYANFGGRPHDEIFRIGEDEYLPVARLDIWNHAYDVSQGEQPNGSVQLYVIPDPPPGSHTIEWVADESSGGITGADSRWFAGSVYSGVNRTQVLDPAGAGFYRAYAPFEHRKIETLPFSGNLRGYEFEESDGKIYGTLDSIPADLRGLIVTFIATYCTNTGDGEPRLAPDGSPAQGSQEPGDYYATTAGPLDDSVFRRASGQAEFVAACAIGEKTPDSTIEDSTWNGSRLWFGNVSLCLLPAEITAAEAFGVTEDNCRVRFNGTHQSNYVVIAAEPGEEMFRVQAAAIANSTSHDFQSDIYGVQVINDASGEIESALFDGGLGVESGSPVALWVMDLNGVEPPDLLQVTLIETPSIDTITVNADNSVTVAYTGVDGATGYRYRLDEGTAVDIGTTNPFTIPALAYDTYSLQMLGYDGAADGPWSAAQEFSTFPIHSPAWTPSAVGGTPTVESAIAADTGRRWAAVVSEAVLTAQQVEDVLNEESGAPSVIDWQVNDITGVEGQVGDPVEFPEGVDSAYLYTAYIDGAGEITVLPGSVLAERADETSVSAPTAQTEVIAYAPHVATGGIASVPSAVTGVEAYAPAVASGASVAVPTAETVSQGYAPQVSTGASVALPAALTNSVAFAPRVGVGATVRIPEALTDAQAFAPDVAGGASVSVPPAETVLAAFAPSVASGASISAPTAETEVVAFAPDIIAGAVLVEVPAAVTEFAAQAPEVSSGASVTVPVAESAVSAIAPTVASGASVTVPTAATEMIAVAPDVTVTRHVNIVVPVAETTAEAYAPEITGGRMVTIPVAETAATAYAPLIQAGALVRIPAAETEVIAYPPTVVSGQPRFRRSVTLEGRYIRSITLAA